MIDLSLGESQTALLASTRKTLASPELDWNAIVREGWFSATDFAAVTDQHLVFIELGRAMIAGPLVGTALAARLFEDAGETDLARRLAQGGLSVGLMRGDFAIHTENWQFAIRADGELVEVVRVLESEPATSLDATTDLIKVLRTESVLTVTDDVVAARLHVLLGAYLVGLAVAAEEMSVLYALSRNQFGRPIGAFQAVKHRCAEMRIRAHAARAQLAVAAVLVDEGQGSFEAAAAHMLAVEAARRNADDNLQNHGGIGFTADHSAGRLLARTQVYSRIGPSVAEQAALVLGAHS